MLTCCFCRLLYSPFVSFVPESVRGTEGSQLIVRVDGVAPTVLCFLRVISIDQRLNKQILALLIFIYILIQSCGQGPVGPL